MWSQSRSKQDSCKIFHDHQLLRSLKWTSRSPLGRFSRSLENRSRWNGIAVTEGENSDNHDPFQWFLKSIVPADTSSPVLDSLSPDTDTSKSSEGTSCSWISRHSTEHTRTSHLSFERIYLEVLRNDREGSRTPPYPASPRNHQGDTWSSPSDISDRLLIP